MSVKPTAFRTEIAKSNTRLSDLSEFALISRCFVVVKHNMCSCSRCSRSPRKSTSPNTKQERHEAKSKHFHTPWRSSKYARLAFVSTKKRTLKFEGEVLLFCWDFLISCSSRRMKLFMVQFWKVMRLGHHPSGQPMEGNSWECNRMQLICRVSLKGNLPLPLSFYQHQPASPPHSSSDVKGHDHILSKFTKLRSTCKNMHILCDMVWKQGLKKLRIIRGIQFSFL